MAGAGCGEGRRHGAVPAPLIASLPVRAPLSPPYLQPVWTSACRDAPHAAGARLPLMAYGEGHRILVTGGAGFCGSPLVDALIARGCDVVAVDNFVTGGKDNVAHLSDHPRFTLV